MTSAAEFGPRGGVGLHALSAVSGELGMLRELLPLLAAEHLPELRRLLRGPRWAGLGPAVELVRGELLDVCARRLVDELGGPWPTYLAGTGELLPAAPDDASGVVP